MPQDGSMNMPPGSMSGSDGDGSINSTPSMDMTMQMNFYWGKDVVVLFSGWPETVLKPMISLFLQASVYAIRMGLAYLVMLSVMSYNLGVFIVAVAGHTAGFLLVKARAHAAANRAVPMSSTPNNSKFNFTI
ncbi:hypothetical protein Pint_35290 [Pistacia integerrima]|uniref:Uncharacterized protein n=1 Tax=Pistacia integerrima TaxID=434235 RepID=A0ACC0XZI5_9ROSI|nr:hypothetical protein Pint_35290 [Pistacia integerrima]